MTVLVENLQEKMEVGDNLEKLVVEVTNIILEKENCSDAEVSLVFVDDEKITELNQKYRNVDKPTDVLSFSMQDNDFEPEYPEGDLMLGDVVVSLETAYRQAQAYNHSLEREVAYLTAHGVLHLLGYNHEDEHDKKVMRESEEIVMNNFNLSR